MFAKGRHFESLDALRGIAALLVLATHVGQQFPSHRPFAAGYLGVDLFFVLSGFVIGLVYEERLIGGGLSLAQYAETRLLRLYPMVLLGLVLSSLAFPHAFGAPDHALGRFAAQALMIPTLWLSGGLFLLNGPQWSLFFELAANAAHAVAVRRLTTGRVMAITTVCGFLLGAAAVSEGGMENMGFLRHTFAAGFVRVGFSFFAGLLLFRVWLSGRLPAWPVLGWSALPLFATAVVLAGYLPSTKADLLVAVIVNPAAVALAAGARAAPSFARVAALAGELSYPLYLLQASALMVAMAVLGPTRWWSVVQVGKWTAFVLLLAIIAFAASRAVDRPVRAAIERRLRLRRTRVLVATAP